ncbi:MAG: DUF4159 domain-containing protein, partial [Candidatus Omnitrophica bacterium]|nr:DUF4159 domain-containing protein [Candidatus Omnitrophota bacterium]
PLPATPLRRSEKKRPPRPSALIGKIAYGEHQDWMTDPGDLDGLLGWMNPKLNLNYGSRTVTINDSRLRTIPILYMTGHNHFQVERDWPVLMRRYLEDGGAMIAEACCGWPPFSESFQRIYPAIFPDKPLRRLPMDHPVYQCYHAIEQVAMMENDENQIQAPELYGTEIGCRTALLFSKADLSCGWDHHTHPEGKRYMPDDAMKLGMNMLVYMLVCRQYAEDYAAQDRVVNEDGDLLVGHLIHNGDWNPNPYAVGKLLSEFAAQCGSSLRIQSKPIRPAPDELKQFPLIYIIGHHAFDFSDAARSALADYLRGGGLLLANNCCGREEFDQSFRREAAKILPEASLAPIALNEPLFQVPFPMDRVSYVMDRFAPSRPPMEGVAWGNGYGVLYFKHGVENGWAGLEYPFGASLIREDSMKLGVNALVFAMTH